MGANGELAALEARLRRVEDEAAIRRLILTYGPAADAGLALGDTMRERSKAVAR
ncbi:MULTISPECIES: hypothetical protein [unclassified Frankia]|uniref:hypothetical protein n=1 Tax=unclassified Frankia TaxID=2632575 RepID=UPI001EE4AE93|nr:MULTISPECIES: hypothetical protein [unclassified Frankia]